MKIADIYTTYHIMPQLQTHMYRVAGVAKLICDHSQTPLDSASTIQAMLLHDMGNILKFDLHKFPEFSQAQGVEYWQAIKDEWTIKYGDDVHEATMEIAKELHVSERVMDLIEGVSFDRAKADYETGDIEKMICEYSDCRVTPFGVMSLEERLEDLEQRYGFRYPSAEDTQKREEFRQVIREIETLIFANSRIKPDEITEAKIARFRQQFSEIEI